MKTLARALAAIAAASLSFYALAADWPVRPIRLVVPYAPGGTADIFARILGPKYTEAWGQQVVVDNRAGANGNIGSEIVAKSAPDGYTLLLGTSGSNAVNPSLYAKMPYNAKRDLAYIAPFAATANVWLTRPNHPAKAIADLVALAKKSPAKLTYGSSGVGSVLHLSGELLNTLAGIKLTHIPYKGSGPSVVALLSGELDTVISNAPNVVPFIDSGKLRALAVTTGKRASALPNVPTMIEAGIPGYDVASWFGVFAPAQTPKDVVEKINAETTRLVKSKAMHDQLVGLAAEPTAMGAAEANRYFHAEIEKWAKVIQASGARAN